MGRGIVQSISLKYFRGAIPDKVIRSCRALMPRRKSSDRHEGCHSVQDFQSRPGHRGNLGEEYARMSIFCHPAYFEGFGLSVAEELAPRIPVVAFSDRAGVNEIS